MSFILKGIRVVLGFLIQTGDRLTAPTPLARTPENQRRVDEQTSKYILYHLPGCPFCVKVRRRVRALGLVIPMKDIATDAVAARELIEGGKQDQVPCLRIDSASGSEWMYESSVINEFLEKNFTLVD